MPDHMKLRRLLFYSLILLFLGWIGKIALPLQAQSWTPIIQRLSTAPDGTPGNENSQYAAISANGQVIAFVSQASNLVAGDTNTFSDVFVRDLGSGAISRVSVASDGTEADNGSGYIEPPALSADGRYVAFVSPASNLVTGDTNNLADVFVHDRQNGQTVRVSVAADGSQGDWFSEEASISADGRYVAFVTRSAFVAEDTNNVADVYVHDRDADGNGIFDEAGAIATVRVSVIVDSSQGNYFVEYNRTGISADGRYVVFAIRTAAGFANIFVHDRDADGDGIFDEADAIATRRVSVGIENTEANNMSYDPSISDDGRYVAFWSHASNLVPNDTVLCGGGTCADIFVFDRDADGNGLFDETGGVAMTLASSSASGVQGDQASYFPRMGDGGLVVFYSLANNLVTGDSAWSDIFIKDVQSGAIVRASVTEANQPADGSSFLPDISADGNRVVFESRAENLVPGSATFHSQIYLFNRQGDLPTPTPTPTATPTATPVPVETPTAQPGDPAWQRTILDVRGFVGQHADIALDANGFPHIAYNSDNAGEGELRYAHWDGFIWQMEVVDEGVSTGEYPSIEIGINGQPRIAYYHRPETALKHAQRNADGTWQTQLVDAGEDRGRYTSMALDPISGVADIIYYERQGTRLLHVRGPAGLWSHREVDDSGDVGEEASLARGPNGLLGAAYYDRSNGALKYAQWNGTTLSWTPETVDNGGDADNDTGRFTAIAFDSLGRPHISYLETGEFNTYNLKYAVRNAAQWSTRTVETGVILGPTALVIGPQDLPVIAYRKQGLRLARLKENVWNIETVDNAVRDGFSLALVRDAAADREHLVYEEGRYNDLGYAVWAPAWQERVVGGGDRPALAVRNGRPTLLYRGAAQTLQRAIGLSGPTWGETPVRAGVGESSNPIVLDANGVEHVAFYEPGRRAIVYATSVNGVWQVEDVAILPEGAFFQPTLRLVLSRGEPHVIYTVYTGSVSLNIAARSNGLWQTSAHPSPQALGTEPNFDALALDSGAVAISYWDAGNGDLRLVTWDGVNWADTLVDAGADGADVGDLNAIARGYDVVNGQTVAETLAIAYYDHSHQSIRYAHTSGGAGWQRRELVPTVGNVTSLDLAVAGDTYALPSIVFTTQDGRVRLAFSDDNLRTVTLETIASDADPFAAHVSLAYDNQPRLAYRNGDGQIVYAFPTARQAVPAPVHNDGRTGVGVLYGAGLDLPVCFYFFLLPATARTATLDVLASAVLSDGQVMGQMTERFRQSSEGQRYLALAVQHAQEMAVIARSDPSLLWDGHRVMQNLMPGLEAWVRGEGDEVIVSQQMADDALAIWQRIAAQASPELAAAINAELATTNNLQTFVGDSFQQWAAQIGVERVEQRIYLPLLNR